MHIPDEDADELREFIKKELRDNSDADPEVLAEYVVALLQADDAPEPQKRIECEQGLQEFLKGDVAAKIVDGIFRAIEVKAYKPGYVPVVQTKAKSKLNAFASAFDPSPVSYAPAASSTSLNGNHKSKKRAYNEFEVDTPRNGTNRRSIKQARRGRASNPTGNVPTMPAAMAAGMQNGAQASAFPGMPTFDANDPASMMMAMQTMMQAMAQFSEMMGIQQASLPNPGVSRAGRCYDYDNKGFCARGSACPYEHGENKVIYAPSAMLVDQSATTNSISHKSTKGKTKQRSASRGRETRGRRSRSKKRSEYAAFGEHTDVANTKIVVENLPEQHWSEDEVRTYYQQFGEVSNVELLSHRRAAIVMFLDHESASNARSSREAVFGDRFVRTFWHKMDYELAHNGDAAEEEQIDPAELQLRIQQAQEAHESKLKRLDEARAQRQELETKMREHALERRKLMQALRAKEKKINVNNHDLTKSGSDLDDEDIELRNKLAALEAEAELLGLDPDDPFATNGFDTASYGSRGRGSYRGRGRGRGAYRGRFVRGGARGGVLRLDNRTRSITINIAPGTADDEKMRQLILTHYEVDAIEPHPNKSESQILTFKQRFMAEEFASKMRGVLDNESVKLSWYDVLPHAVTTAANNDAVATESAVDVSDADVQMQQPPDEKQRTAAKLRNWREDRDLDIADDDDDDGEEEDDDRFME